MTVGLPRALLYHQYGVLWETFFSALGCVVVVSGACGGIGGYDDDDDDDDDSDEILKY